jgi:hypothetical protein
MPRALMLLLLGEAASSEPNAMASAAPGCPLVGDPSWDPENPPLILSWHVHIVWPCPDRGAREKALALRERRIQPRAAEPCQTPPLSILCMGNHE